MALDSEINWLVANILEGNSYMHCRLCLEGIKDNQFVNFHDSIAYSKTEDPLQLHELLKKIFENEVSSEIAGIDAICSDCLDKMLEMYMFIQQVEAATQKLHKVLDNLTSTLDNNIIENNRGQMYIVCHQDESQLIFVQNDEKKPVSKVSFKCNSCKEKFCDLEIFIAHNRDMHNLFTCDKCLCSSTNEADVLEHKTSMTLHKCDSCSQYRCTEESLKEHEASSHRDHMCQECGKAFKGLEKLLLHEQKHVTKNECPKCSKTYTTKEFFDKHVKLCLEDGLEPHPMRSKIVKTYFCQKCGKGYSTQGGLRVHQRFVHGNAEHHICKECGKKFTAPCYLKVHMVTHTKEKNFPCDICQGRFVSKEALLYHRRRHTGEKPYSCDECGERFVNASARVEHIKFKHIGPTLSCEICSRKFVTKNILRIHMKKHHDPTNKLYIGRNVIPHNR